MRHPITNTLALVLNVAALGSFAALTQCSAASTAGSSGSSGQPQASESNVDAGRAPDAEAISTAPAVACDPDAGITCAGPSSMACCGGVCVDTAADPKNCGQCGNACTLHQFCTGTACDDAVVANVCGNASATVVTDMYAADNEGGAAIGAALTANCTPPTKVSTSAENVYGVTASGGRPVTGVGNTFVAGGGGYGHIGIAYLDSSNLTPLYPSVDGQDYDVVERSTGSNVVATTFTALTAQHDFFYVELTVEPTSGTLALAGVGLQGPGTQAAGYYMGAELVPNRAKYPNAWYVYEWTDANGDSIPNEGDTFTQIATGNP